VGGAIGYEDVGKDWAHSLVLATGSADGCIYLFDLSKSQVSVAAASICLRELAGTTSSDSRVTVTVVVV
jgi:hypothetical protein